MPFPFRRKNKSPEAREAPDAVKAAEAPEAQDVPEAIEGAEAVEAANAVEAAEAPETQDMPEAVEGAEAVEAANAVEADEASEIPEVFETPDVPEAPDSVGSIPADETTEDSPLEPVAPEPAAPGNEVAPQRRRPTGSPVRGLGGGSIVTVSLDHDVIRVVVFRGKQVVGWGTASADESPGDDGDDDLPGEKQASRVLALLEQLKVRGGRVVTDLPLNAPLLRHLHVPKMRRRYLQDVIEAEVKETIPFSLEEIDLAWHAQKNGAGEDVVAAAVSKQTMDTHVQLLADAGLRPRAVYPRALALAHAADIAEGIVTVVEPTRASFVLVRGRVPQAVYEVDLKAKSASVADQAQAVARAVEEVAGFAQSLDHAGSDQPLPVVLTGQSSSEGPLSDQLRQTLQREVLPLEPPLQYPDHFAPNEYAVNLGLALTDGARRSGRGKSAAGVVPTVNLLPKRYLPRPLPVRPIAVVVGLVLLGLLAFVAGNQADSKAGEAAALSAQLDRLQLQERQLRLNRGIAQGIERDTVVAAGLTVALEGQLADLEVDMGTLMARLEMLTEGALPSGVTLSAIAQQGGSFSLTGSATSYQDALDYMTNLRASGLFTDARLQEVTASGGGQSDPQRQGIVTVAFQAKAFTAVSEGEDADDRSR